MSSHRPVIMHIVYSFDVGGLENGVVNIINRMPSERFRHIVVALTRCAPEFCKRVTNPGVEFISLDKPAGHGIWLYPKLVRLFREIRPSVVHTRNLAALEASVPAWWAGVPVRVHGEHGWEESDPHGEQFKFKILRRVYSPFVDHYVALSGHLESYLSGRVGISQSRIERICNGVDIDRFRPRTSTDGAPFGKQNEVWIGSVGRLQAVKDQLSLIRAFSSLCAVGGDVAKRVRLVIVGDGPLRSSLDAEVVRLGLSDHVWMAGERTDIPEIMRAIDVFALPSISEGISNTVLEAMASGLPVVATDVGGNAELILSGSTGMLIAARDHEALADALRRYVEDPALRSAHGAAGRQRVEEKFSLGGMVERYACLYERLIRACA